MDRVDGALEVEGMVEGRCNVSPALSTLFKIEGMGESEGNREDQLFRPEVEFRRLKENGQRRVRAP